MSDNMKDTGLALIAEMQGADFAAGIQAAAAAGGFGAGAAELAITGTFGAVWAREGLARRDRSIVVMAILLTQGQMAEFKNHVRFGLNNGLTPREIEEILYQAQPYAGWAAVSQGLAAAVEVLRERGLMAGDIKTADERGLI